MKNITFFSFIVCSALLLLPSCEKSGDQFTTKFVPGKEQITTRTADTCEDCPNGCCCCNIAIAHLTTVANLSICGVCEGDYLCGTYSPPSPCSSVSGQGQDIILTTLIPRKVFCVPAGGSFRIFNNGDEDVDLSFTCQFDMIDPDVHDITIPAHQSRFFVSDGECFVEGPCL